MSFASNTFGSTSFGGLPAGQNVTFAVGAGSFTLTGEPATLFALTQEAAATGFYRLAGNAVFLSYDIALGVPGAAISGGTFTRGRWRALVAELAAEAAADARAREAKQQAAQKATREVAQARRAALAAAHAQTAAAAAAAAHLRALADARLAFDRVADTSRALRHALALRAAAAKARVPADAEEDEAIAVLLAA